MPNTKVMLMWTSLHLVLWAIQTAFGGLLGVDMCTSFGCHTPLEGLGRLAEKEPDFSLTFLVSVLTSFGGTILGLFVFDYEFLEGAQHGIIHGLIGNIIKVFGIIASLMTTVAIIGLIFQRR